MECMCEVQSINNDEEYYFLDDQNTQPLLEAYNSTPTQEGTRKCFKCDKIQRTSNIPDTDFLPGRSRTTNLLKDPTYSSNSSGVSADSPLLNNDLSDTEGIHCHRTLEDDSAQSNNISASRRLYFALILCFIFMFVELIGGYLASSLAIMTDSAHMCTDVVACIISISAIYIAKKKPTKQYPFGYHRAEIVGALISIIFIWMLSIFFVIFAIHRMVVGEYEINSLTMLIIAIIGLVVNAIQIVILHGASFSSTSGLESDSIRSHNHSHENINLRAAIIHVIGDLLQSVGIILAALIIMYEPKWQIIDPICTVIFAVIVLFTTKSIIRDSINVLMEGFPYQLNYDEVYKSLKTINHVKHVHNIQIWSLTTQRFNASVHLAVDSGANKDKVLETAVQIFRKNHGIYNCTIQIENYDEITMLRCPECKVPVN